MAVPSAQSLSNVLIERCKGRLPAGKDDWVWIAVVCLWERWFSDRPNFEMIDDLMQAGYRNRELNQSVEAADTWSLAWYGIGSLMLTFEIPTIEEFDNRFAGTNSVFN